MTSGAEQFVIALARASQRARRYLRGLAAADREDVLATAILWCWEHKTTYDPSVALDDWFVGAIRNALRDWRRGEGRNNAELVEVMQAPDDPSTHAEAIEAVEAVAKALSPEEQRIAELITRGHTRKEIRDVMGPMANDAVAAVRVRLRGMRDLMPDFKHVSRIIRSARTPAAAASADAEITKPIGIDREIARLEFTPPGGADCPPCWKCKYFDGYLPLGSRSTGMVIVEPEVRDAVRETELRKLAIAARVRGQN